MPQRPLCTQFAFISPTGGSHGAALLVYPAWPKQRTAPRLGGCGVLRVFAMTIPVACHGRRTPRGHGAVATVAH
jgi:hypothetical protein